MAEARATTQPQAGSVGQEPTPPARSSPWAPFRSAPFRSMAVAQFISNIGGWMQTVGAQELMLTLTTSATFVALIQTAAGLPVMLLAIPAGALGDIMDRRRLLIVSQSFMLLAAIALAVLALGGSLTPWLLLGLIFAVGVGQTFTSPTWQTLQPELVPAEDRPQAIALGSVNQNLSRAVGPAIGGALYAATSAAALFFVNAASFVPVIGAVFRWHPKARTRSEVAPEQAWEAIRAGARYVAASPALRVILIRAGSFMLFANAIWALLPLVAHSYLRLGSSGYGLLLGGVGIGAVAGAGALPRLRGRLAAGTLLTTTTVALAAMILALAYVRSVRARGARRDRRRGAHGSWPCPRSAPPTRPPCRAGSRRAGWLTTWWCSKVGARWEAPASGSSPSGPRCRPPSCRRRVLLALSGALGLLLHFRSISPEELLPAGDWPEPHAWHGAHPAGPVLVTVEYHARRGRAQELVDALHAGRYARRRTGAVGWQVWRDAAEPDRILERFSVGSWDEHIRQGERVSRRDQQRLDDIRAIADPERPAVVTHWVVATP